jgi:DNA-binding NarL/FixJ family response regulator
MRVLVIDDAAVARAAFARMAEGVGHTIVAQSDGSEGPGGLAELAERHRVDAVVIDGRLYADGMTTAIARLRQVSPRLHIVVLAALGETGLVRAAIDAGASAALLRPLVPSRVAEALAPRAKPEP